MTFRHNAVLVISDAGELKSFPLAILEEFLPPRFDYVRFDTAVEDLLDAEAAAADQAALDHVNGDGE